MSGADLWEDGYPHGTLDGYRGGCRGSACPGEHDYGMSCKRANMLHAGDYRYDRLVKSGHTPAEIATIIDGRQEPTPTSPEEPTMAAPTPKPPTKRTKNDDIPAPEVPPAPLTTDPWTEGLTLRAKRAKVYEIREWCRNNGHPDVGVMARIPQAALAAYAAAHTLDGTETAPDETPATADATPVEENETKPVTIDPEVDTEPPAEDVSVTDLVLDAAHSEISDALDKKITEERPPIAESYVSIRVDTSYDDFTELQAKALDPAEWTDAIAQARDRADLDHYSDHIKSPRPDWADVAISEDVERARRIAVALEQQLTQAEEERDAAQRALTTAITQYGVIRARLEAAELQLLVERTANTTLRMQDYAFADLRRVQVSSHRRWKRGNR